MAKYTKEDIIDLVEEEDVAFIRLQFTDIFGNLKNIAVTKRQIVRALNNEIMFDGSAIEGFARVEQSDMRLYPDLDTFEIFPWRPQTGKVARLLCNVRTADGDICNTDPRQVLSRVLSQASEEGYQISVGPECEFFLFDTDEFGNATNITKENAGYFDIGPKDFGENARRDIVLTLEDIGFEVEASHHENAPGQHEVDFKYSEALHAADDIMTFKLVVKTIAKRHGLHASFMPKPNRDAAGSGMHLNFSLEKDGVNQFYDGNDPEKLSKTAYYFIGGLMKHMKAICFITNPLVNSYKRFVPGYEAPVHIAWSSQNRSPLIRIPYASDGHTRVELRNPDPSANPYLAMAVCIAAGLDGIHNEIVPPASVDANIYEMSRKELAEANIEKLPGSLRQALAEFEKDELIINALGKELSQKLIDAKYKEYKEYSAQVTNWEIERYLRD